MAFAEYGPSVAAGVEDACQSGMRHGVMEQFFVTRGIANLAADVVTQARSVLPAADMEAFCVRLPDRWRDRCLRS